jgi:phage-related protein
MELDSDFSAKFNNYDLGQIPYVVLTQRNPNSMPDRELKTIPLVRQHGSIVVGDRWTKKVVPIFAYILAPTRQLYEQTIDELKWRLSAPQRSLVLTQAGSERVYTATCANMPDTFIEGGKSFIQMNFECNDPFGTDTEVITYDTGTFTTATKSFDHVYEGFADAAPILLLTLGTITGGTNKTITLGNSVSGQSISITGNWASNDVIRIDCAAQSVTVNGLGVPFTGFFPSFSPQTAFTTYTDTLTTRSAALKIVYSKKYF